MVRSYDLSLVLSPEITEDRIEAIKDQVRVYVTDRGGEVTNEDYLGRKSWLTASVNLPKVISIRPNLTLKLLRPNN